MLFSDNCILSSSEKEWMQQHGRILGHLWSKKKPDHLYQVQKEAKLISGDRSQNWITISKKTD